MNVLIMRYRLDMGDFDSFTLCLGAPGAFFYFILFSFNLFYWKSCAAWFAGKGDLTTTMIGESRRGVALVFLSFFYCPFFLIVIISLLPLPLLLYPFCLAFSIVMGAFVDQVRLSRYGAAV